jgi:hypothetical protein
LIVREGLNQEFNLWKIVDSSGQGVKRGSAGAPLISKESGNVIGMVSHKESGKAFYAISIEHLKGLIGEKSIFPFQNLMPLQLQNSDSHFKNKEKYDSVVMISSTENSNLGTGFSVYQDKGGSYILTTNHIVEYTVKPMINGYYTNVEIISTSERLNLALLYVKGLYIEPLELQDKDIVSQEVELVGYSRFTHSENRKEIIEAHIVPNCLSIVPIEGDSYQAWKISTHKDYELNRATSGAPLVSKKSGKVIGVFADREGSNIGYATSIYHLKELISQNRLKGFQTLKPFDLDTSDSFFHKGYMQNSVVLIGSKENSSFGTGFVVYQDSGGSYIVTANDVIETTVSPIINGQYSVEIIRSSEMFQLGILYVSDFFEEPFVLQSEDISNREIEMMGYSAISKDRNKKEALEAQIISDNLKITDTKGQSYKAWEIQPKRKNSFEKGIGGTPLISKETNKVIGIFMYRQGSNTGFATSIEHLKDVWNGK